MAREVTQRQRAEQFYNSLLKSAGVLGYETPRGRFKRLQLLLAHDQQTRQEALREAAERLGVGDANGLLEAPPCLWCGYNGEGYYQAGTHGQSCPWHTIGGCDERLDRLAREGVR